MKEIYILIITWVLISIYLFYVTRENFNRDVYEKYTNTESKIPKIIWQTYKTKKLPVDASKARQSWIDKNPGWEVNLYDDDDIEKYILEHWDNRMYKFYKALPIGVMKADLWRYLILTTHGGVYADVDSICKVPIETWTSDLNIKNKENILVFGLENDTNFCQWSMLSTPNHDAMNYICKYILLNFEKNGIDIRKENIVHITTGPSIWTDAIRSYLQIDQKINTKYILDMYNNNKINNDEIIILPYESFNITYVQNLYGSQNFGDNYVKWIDEIKILQQKVDKTN